MNRIVGSVALASLTLLPLAGHAVEKCKAKQASDGTLLVSAKGVSGTLRFGYTEDRRVTAISVDAAGDPCIADGTAKNCALAAEGNDARTSLPPYCTLYLEDSESTCEAEVKRCLPGLRAACPADMVRLGAGCIERTRNVAEEWADATATCHARGRSLCAVRDIMACDSLNLGNGTALTCGTLTDAPSNTSLWTATTNSEDGQSAFSRPVRYGSDNALDEQATGTGGMYQFFCCGPLGTP